MTSKTAIPLHLSKFIDENLRNMPYYAKLLNGEINLTVDVGTVARMNEVARITGVIEAVYNGLDEDKKTFVDMYYFSDEKLTIEGVSQRLFINERTGRRWKKSIAREIAIGLGWI